MGRLLARALLVRLAKAANARARRRLLLKAARLLRARGGTARLLEELEDGTCAQAAAALRAASLDHAMAARRPPRDKKTTRWSTRLEQLDPRTPEQKNGSGCHPNATPKETKILPALIGSDLNGLPRELLGLSLVAVSAVCFSVVATLVKVETRHGLSSMEAIFWRSAGAFVLNGIAMLTRCVSMRVPREARRAMALQCVFGFACTAFAFYAISRMVLADASVLIFLSPVLTIFLGALFLDERIDRVSLACALFSIVGVICVVRPSIVFGEQHDDDDNTIARAPTLAVVSALLAAVTQALLYVSVRQLQSVHSLVVTHYFALFGAVVSLVFMSTLQSHITWPSTTDLQLAAAGTGVFAFVGQVALTKGFQLEHAGVAAVMRYLDVVCVFVWDSMFLEEPVNAWSVVGAAIVCACALVCALRKARLLRSQPSVPPAINCV